MGSGEGFSAIGVAEEVCGSGEDGSETGNGVGVVKSGVGSEGPWAFTSFKNEIQFNFKKVPTQNSPEKVKI